MIPGWDKEGWRTYIFGRHKACFGCILYHFGRFSLIDDAFGNVIVILFLYNVPNNPMHNVSSILTHKEPERRCPRISRRIGPPYKH